MYGLDLIKGYIVILVRILELTQTPIIKRNTVMSKRTAKAEYGVLILAVKFFT